MNKAENHGRLTAVCLSSGDAAAGSLFHCSEARERHYGAGTTRVWQCSAGAGCENALSCRTSQCTRTRFVLAGGERPAPHPNVENLVCPIRPEFALSCPPPPSFHARPCHVPSANLARSNVRESFPEVRGRNGMAVERSGNRM